MIGNVNKSTKCIHRNNKLAFIYLKTLVVVIKCNSKSHSTICNMIVCVILVHSRDYGIHRLVQSKRYNTFRCTYYIPLVSFLKIKYIVLNDLHTA